MVLTPRRWRQVSRVKRETTVTTKPDHRGEPEGNRKTIARGMPGVSGVTVVTMLVCFFILHARLRAHRAPGIPCALFGAESSHQNSSTCGENAKPCLESFVLVLRVERGNGWLCIGGIEAGLLRYARNDGAA